MMQPALEQDWDVIVIGTGMGGGTIGRCLAEAGMSVLFIEKGHAGHRAEETQINIGMPDPVARAIRGFWPDQIEGTVDGKSRRFFAPLGSGAGGSSVFYAATLERPEPHDLDDSPDKPHPTGGWPVSYDEMAPWFDKAQRMYRLHGDPDPLSDRPTPALNPPPPIGPGDAAIIDRLQANGIHPYRLHTAVSYLPGCTECLGRKCPRPCKMDGRSAGLEPALATGRAALLDRCEVTALRGRQGHIEQVEVLRDGQTHLIAAKRVVLAAGAYSSPRLLLASAAPHWPNGCANGNDQVGRYLMFHLDERFALWPGKAEKFAGASKAVGFRDLYHHEGKRFGMVQAMGVNATYGEIAYHLRTLVERSVFGRFRLVKELTRIPAFIASKLLGGAKLYVGLLEDFPMADNRILLDPANPRAIRFSYAIGAELRSRRAKYRKAIKAAFRGQKMMFLTRAADPNFGHPCGTLRMGDDPATSVVDRNCRAHEVDNLWVADASFMPTSMGVNPSLTIAANAIRVATCIAENKT